MFKSVNPYTGNIIATYREDENIGQKIQLSEQAYIHWSTVSLTQKIDILRNFAQKLFTTETAQLISLEMGKPFFEAKAEIEKCVATCYSYCDSAQELLEPVSSPTSHSYAYYIHQPLGTILAIMPWNFPFWQALRFAIPNILLGNTVLLKHAPNVLGSALNIEKAFLEAGLPKGVFQCLNIDVPSVEKVISQPGIKGVTLTGSGTAGASVASLAGKYLKKTVLELGGSDPFLVLDDANVGKAAQQAVQSRFQNAGQTCIAAKRWIVHERIYDQFKNSTLEAIEKIVVGDPLHENTSMGPVARPDLAEKIENQFNNLVNSGAFPLGTWERQQCLIKPQILEISSEISHQFTEEMFGPVGFLLKVKSEEEAITIANDTMFGLGASIWTEDIEKGETLAKRINSGSVFVNSMVKSEALVPFGGVNQSGYGRELAGYGMYEFSNVKSIVVDK